MKITFCSFLCLITSFALGADRPYDDGGNYYEAFSRPAETYDAVVRGIAAEVAKSRVPTAKEAEKIALQLFVTNPGLDARERWTVRGLYRLGRDVPEFGTVGNLFWEVRVSRIVEGRGVSGVIWVSCSTAAARVLFP